MKSHRPSYAKGYASGESCGDMQMVRNIARYVLGRPLGCAEQVAHPIKFWRKTQRSARTRKSPFRRCGLFWIFTEIVRNLSL